MSEYRTILEEARERFPSPALPLQEVLLRRDRRRRRRRLVADAVGLAVGLVAVLLASSVIRTGGELPATNTSPLPRNGVIALPPVGDTLTLFDPRTGTRTQLDLRTGPGGNEVVGFAWSPDGTKFAYTTWQQGTVRVFDLATGQISTIAPCDSPPRERPGCVLNLAWSPDGSRIALSGPGGLDLIEPDGSDRTTLIGRGYIGPATWSPDGSALAFTADFRASRNRHAVYRVDADGSDLRVLFDQSGGATVGGVRWSPDGSRIAYLVEVPLAPLDGTSTYPIIPEVWVVDADGSQASKLFEGGACCAGGNWTGLSWSPDGTKIALVAMPPGTPYGAASDGRLYTLDPRSGVAQVLARHVSLTGPPSWQPVPRGRDPTP